MINRKTQKGFSLIELLIVVAIILIIAAIAIPNLLRARMAANESSAAGSLRTINTANATYQTTYGHSFAPTATALGGATLGPGVTPPCTQANLVDPVLGTDPATKSGYTFVYVATTPDNSDTTCGSMTLYNITATPVTENGTGIRGFYTDQTGVIRYDPNGNATAASTVLGG